MKNLIIGSIALNGLLAKEVVGNKFPFTYNEESTEDTYGLKDWDKVHEEQYAWDWDRYFTSDGFNKNKCEWKPDSKGHNQSPIDIDNWTHCDLEKDDKHRWVTFHGKCKWDDLIWKVQPWGLEMSFPTPSKGDPSKDPCERPGFDSSGGYGNLFYVNHMTVKTPSEHYIQGRQYDAEITYNLFRYKGSNPSVYGGPPYTGSILVNAEESSPDNPMLEPYIVEWEEAASKVFNDCRQRFAGSVELGFATVTPTTSPAPSSSPAPTISAMPTQSPTTEDHCSADTTTLNASGEDTRKDQGIMFDVESTSSQRMLIRALDLTVDVDDDDVEVVVVQIYSSERSWVSDEAGVSVESKQIARNETQWVNMGTYNVSSFNTASAVGLREPLELLPGQTRAFHVVVVTDDDDVELESVRFGRNDVGEVVVEQDDNLRIMVGMAVEGTPFDNMRQGRASGRGLNGAIHYSFCRDGMALVDEEVAIEAIANTTDAVVDDDKDDAKVEDGADKANLRRRLDHKNENGKASSWDLHPYFDIWRLLPSPWFYRYRGSLTVPMCWDDTRVRVIDRPLEISATQLRRIQVMLAQMRDSETCQLATVGRRVADEPNMVQVNRPLQRRNKDHNLKYCDVKDWSSDKFFNTPRGNTCWCLLTKECKVCDTDKYGNCNEGDCDSHWFPRDTVWKTRNGRTPDCPKCIYDDNGNSTSTLSGK